MNKINFKVLKKFNSELIDLIKKLEVENLGADASVNEWQIPVLIRYGKFIVAEISQGNIIGVCEMIREWDEPKTAFIHSFYVKKEFRNKGIGKKLLDFAINTLKSESFKFVELTLDIENKPALSLYESFGFRIKEYRPDEYGRGINRYLMVLELK